MTPALAARLRRIARGYEPTDLGVADNMDEAADEIDRLTEEVARLQGAVSEIEAHLRSGDENGAYLIAVAALKEPT